MLIKFCFQNGRYFFFSNFIVSCQILQLIVCFNFKIIHGKKINVRPNGKKMEYFSNFLIPRCSFLFFSFFYFTLREIGKK